MIPSNVLYNHGLKHQKSSNLEQTSFLHIDVFCFRSAFPCTEGPTIIPQLTVQFLNVFVVFFHRVVFTFQNNLLQTLLACGKYGVWLEIHGSTTSASFQTYAKQK